MAYSDYGGYAYRNGVRVEERSDAVLSPDGIKSTPGQWPGWTIPEGRAGHSVHVLLGDGPIFVGLYKQSTLTVHRLGEELNLLDLLSEPVTPEMISEYEWAGRNKHLNSDYFKERELPCVLKRGWYTGYRGPLLVHAAKKQDGEVRDFMNSSGLRDVRYSHGLELEDFHFGAIIGRVDLIGCSQMSRMPQPSEREQSWGNWAPDRYAWERGPNPVIFPRPIPYQGSQGFFDVAACVLESIPEVK